MPKHVVRPDTVVQRAVEAELYCHPDLDETNMLVRVKDGVVTLFGYAQNLFHKYGAEEAAKRVAGVAAVVNDIELYCTRPRHGVSGTRV